MIPQRIPAPTRDVVTPEIMVAMAQRWGISCDLAARLLNVAGMLPWDIQIISGARSRSEQQRLEDQGAPTAPFDLSTHANETPDGCPRLATGADVTPVLEGIRQNRPAIAQLGAAAVHAGLRWGGGSPADESGMPSDPFHFDLGPRSSVP